MSEWYLTHAEGGTIGPVDIDTVIEGISDGRVPLTTTVRSRGERDSKALTEVPVFALAVRAAPQPFVAARVFEGLLEADRERQAMRVESELLEEVPAPPLEYLPPALDPPTFGERFAVLFPRELRTRLVVPAFAFGAVFGISIAVIALRGDVQPEVAMSVGKTVLGTARRALSSVAQPVSPLAPPPAPVTFPFPAEPTSAPSSQESVPPRFRTSVPQTSASPPEDGSNDPNFSDDPMSARLTPPLGPKPHEPPRPPPPKIMTPGF